MCKLHVILAVLLLAAGAAHTVSPSTDFKDALKKSILFYSAQQSGKIPATNQIGWRGEAWIDTQAPDESDLSGGYFDGTDYIQYTLPLAFAMTQLAWSILEFPRGYRDADQLESARGVVRWGLEWLLKAHYKPHELVVQVGNAGEQQDIYSAPEQDAGPHRVYVVNEKNPGSDVAGAVAAALAAGHMIFKPIDGPFARECMTHAKDLFWFAHEFRGRYSDNMPAGQLNVYNSSSYEDDLYWAAAWVYRASRDKVYLQMAASIYEAARNAAIENMQWNWDNTFWGAALLWRQMEGALAGDDLDADLDTFFGTWFQGNDTLGVNVNHEGFSCMNVPASNGVTANAAFLAMLASKIPNPGYSNQLICLARDLASYLLGQNGDGFSYMVGYGEDFPKNPGSKAAACGGPTLLCDVNSWSSAQQNVQELTGALVSGTCGADEYKDTRLRQGTNGVRLDINAGFTGLLAGLNTPAFTCKENL